MAGIKLLFQYGDTASADGIFDRYPGLVGFDQKYIVFSVGFQVSSEQSIENRINIC